MRTVRSTGKAHTGRRALALAGVLLAAVLLTTGCASRREIVQFQEDHNEFRARLDALNNRADDINARLDRIEPKVDTLNALLGGNVREVMREQEALIRSMKADQSSLSGELERMIEQLSSRVSESDAQLQSLLLQLDTFNQLAARVVGDSLANDAIESERLFQQSYSDYLRGDFETARMGFEQYVESYPANKMADDALYWAGETWLSQQQPDSANALFIQLENRYPDSNRLPTALLKRAIIRQEEGDLNAAERLLERVVNDYPDSEDAPQAKLRLKELENAPKDTTGE